ncbi:unnamed protein product [Jaminaea pallidilutea]
MIIWRVGPPTGGQQNRWSAEKRSYIKPAGRQSLMMAVSLRSPESAVHLKTDRVALWPLFEHGLFSNTPHALVCSHKHRVLSAGT